MGKLRVTKVGALATIQDEGRFGFRQYGIPQSGAMDREALHVANSLVGNSPNFPVIEVAMQGIRFRVEEPTTVGITGAEVSVQVDDMVVDMNRSIQLNQEQEVRISNPKKGVYFYIGIRGKLSGDFHFGSYSTYLMAGFGGMNGRALEVGDFIESNQETGHTSDWFASSDQTDRIRIMKGPEWHLLKDSPDRKEFIISPESNRMGIRLAGATIDIEGSEIDSSAVIPGTIQLPPDGHPIVLMNDCQTTGGYPRIGKVIDEDLGRLAQLRPGEKVRFAILES